MHKKKTLLDFRKMKKDAEKVAWITAYDYPTAVAAERAEIDMILVGDSGTMTMLGYPDTHAATMEEMIILTKAVRRGAPNTFIIGDMPQGSYEATPEDAVRNAMRFVKEAGVDAVKLEGNQYKAVKAISGAGINVVGHLGLTPQSSETFGAYKVQGKTPESLMKICSDAYELEVAGCCFMLIEAMPEISGKTVCSVLKIPTYGIGTGRIVDGQLLIVSDMLGNYPNFIPKFAHNFVDDVLQNDVPTMNFERPFEDGEKLGFLRLAEESIRKYIAEVKNGNFPYPNNIYSLGCNEDEFMSKFAQCKRTNLVKRKV